MGNNGRHGRAQGKRLFWLLRLLRKQAAEDAERGSTRGKEAAVFQYTMQLASERVMRSERDGGRYCKGSTQGGLGSSFFSRSHGRSRLCPEDLVPENSSPCPSRMESEATAVEV